MFEYKEIIRKKDGRRLVFCNLEELLMEFYGVNSMEEVEPNANGSGEYIIHCPFCKEEGHTKHKLYIKSDLSVGHCFVCTRAFIHVSDQVDLSFQIPDFIGNIFDQYKGHPDVVRLSDPNWSLENYFNEFDDFDEKGYKYLMGRHKFMDPLYKILDFKFWDGNVVMPFKYHGEVFYYQIRFSGTGNIRYFFPPISKKPPYIIEHGDMSGKVNLIVVEGVFDAIAALIMAPEFIPVAVLGSSISDYQLDFIREYNINSICVFMDKTDISTRIAQKIKSKVDYCPIRIIPSNGEDPEERMKRYMKIGKDLQWIHPPKEDNFLNDIRVPKLNLNLF